MKIVIIEDDAGYAELITRTLDGLADSIQVATDWDTGERLISDKADMVWVDLRLPPRTFEADSVIRIRQLRQRHPDLVIIVASGYISPEIKIELKDSGVDDFLYKGGRFDGRQVGSLILRSLVMAGNTGRKINPAILTKATEWLLIRFPNAATPAKP